MSTAKTRDFCPRCSRSSPARSSSSHLDNSNVTKGVIAPPHRLASEAGAQVLRDGGNAIDAAIAADAVLCVVYPQMTSVAGDLMAIVWPAGAAAPVGLIGAGRSGELATIEAMRQRGHDVMPERGPLTVTVPGTVQAAGRPIQPLSPLRRGPAPHPAPPLPPAA